MSDIPSTKISTRFSHTWKVGNLVLTATIPPYVWMYKRPLIDVVVKDSTRTDLRFTNLPVSMDGDEAELIRLVEALSISEVVCKDCKKSILKRYSEYRREDECEECCQMRLSVEFKLEAEEMRGESEKQDKKQYVKGFRFKANIWVHAGEDDYPVVAYFKASPSDTEIYTILKNKKSKVFDDFSVHELKA